MEGLPDRVDLWRMVVQRRVFSGRILAGGLARLRDLLAAADDELRYVIEFGTDELGTPFAAIAIDGHLTLTCQRSLEPYREPVAIRTRLGLIRDEREEAALPPGYEPLLVPVDGKIDPAELLADELLLALPLVPADPRVAPLGEPVAPPTPAAGEHPFAILKRLGKA
ncbi:MAG: YceD family protein [Xanthomonadales bacterium]|nr:YceD family protein [Xanthomonadales bacterium]